MKISQGHGIAPVLLAALMGLACASTGPVAPEPPDFAESRRLGREAFAGKDFSSASRHFQDALLTAPDHPSLLVNVAAMETLGGNHDVALRFLERLAALDLYLNVAAEEIFSPLRESPRFAEVVRKLERSRDATMSTSRPILTFPAKGIIPEGLAFDSSNGDHLVSSVRERKIFRVSRDGKASVFASRDAGLLSGMGMRIDQAARVLWVATSAAPQMEEFDPAKKGVAMVMKFDLDSGRLLATFRPPVASPLESSGAETQHPEHWFGDLTLAKDGTVYVTDSTQPEIYRISPGSGSIEPFLRDARFQSLQGIDVSSDGRTLFVTDYSTGLYRIDVAGRKIEHLKTPPGVSLIGVDGLYRCGKDLLGVQNGINPHRLIRIAMGRATIRDVSVIDRNHPSFQEPTLGVVSGSRFSYIANGHWEAVDRENQLLPADRLHDPVILGFDAGCKD